MMPKFVLTTTLLALLSVMAACNRPLAVDVDPTGATLLALAGERDVTGTLKRDLVVGGVVYQQGTEVRVLESWLIRKDKSKQPPSYRCKGFYDPAQQASGFVLPARAVDVYVLSAVGPDFKRNIPVPLAQLKRDGAQ